MLTRLRLGFSYLCKHKFRQGFKDTYLGSLKPQYTISGGAIFIMQNEPPL